MNSNDPFGDARKLWSHIYGNLEGFLCIASAVRNLDDHGVPIKSGKGATDNKTFSEKYFWYPEEIDRALAYIREVNSMPLHEVWCSKSLFETRKRKESNVVACGALAVELDGPPLPNGSVTPTAVVVSSPAHLNDDGKDHFHPYFALSRPTLPREARDLNKRLGRWTGDRRRSYPVF